MSDGAAVREGGRLSLLSAAASALAHPIKRGVAALHRAS